MSAAFRKSRFTNAIRCYTSYALSLCGSVHISHMPLFVSVEPAAVCQLRCPECPVGQAKTAALTEHRPATPDRTQPFMSMEVFRRVLEQVRETAWVMQFYFQGEPLLCKDLPQMIAEAHREGLYTIVSTNAQAMTAEMADALVQAGLDRIIVSMDGLTEQSYGAYRVGGSLEKCKEALRWLREAKEKQGKCQIELQCLRLRTNEQDWSALQACYKDLGADRLTLKTAQLYDYQDGHPLMPTDPRYSRYVQGKDGRYHRRKLRRGCVRVWSGCVVTTNGDVLPCCYDKAHAHAYGNIMNAPMRELFCSDKAHAFRRVALNEELEICKECWR